MPLIFDRIRKRIQSVWRSIKLQLFRNNEEKLIQEIGYRQFIGFEFEQEGNRQFEYVKSLGVNPDTRFLDVACGPLRLGRHLIPYLNEQCYFGVEQHQSLVDSGLAHEIDADVVDEKKPEFFITSSFVLNDLEGINIAWANSLFSHLVEKDIMTCLINLEKALAKGGVFYATFFEGKRNRFVQLFGSHSRVGFLYTKDQMAGFGSKAGFETEYFGGVENSRGQKMMAFRKA